MFRFTLLFVCLAATQEGPSRFEAETNLVLIDVQVYRKVTGNYVGHLNKQDFKVFDNGIEQELSFCEFRATPLDLVFLLDTSGSMAESVRTVARGAYAALESLRPDDRIAVVSFSSRSQVEVGFTNDRRRIVDAIEAAADRVARVDSGTRLYDALASSLDLFGHRGGNMVRRAILAVTDDQEQKSIAKLETLATVALEKGVTVNGLIFIGDRWSRQRSSPRADVRSIRPLVETTGGEYRYAAARREAMAEMFDRLRARYTLAYVLPQPQRTRGTHHIAVHLTERARALYPDALLRARSRYTY